MGAWDIGSFDNDDAMDWLGELVDLDNPQILDFALGAVADAEDVSQLNVEECAVALAAAEIVAALRGQPSADLPDMAREWVESSGDISLGLRLSMARRAVRDILEQSELKVLWEDAGRLSYWSKSVEDLLERLGVQSSKGRS